MKRSESFERIPRCFYGVTLFSPQGLSVAGAYKLYWTQGITLYLKPVRVLYTLYSLWTRVFVIHLFTESKEMYSVLSKYLMQKWTWLKASWLKLRQRETEVTHVGRLKHFEELSGRNFLSLFNWWHLSIHCPSGFAINYTVKFPRIILLLLVCTVPRTLGSQATQGVPIK